MSAAGTDSPAITDLDRGHLRAAIARAADARRAGELPYASLLADASGAVVRQTHHRLRSLAGDSVGTPMIALGPATFFGPVCTAIPRGPDALALFDAVRAAARCAPFTELKRARSDSLTFD